MANCCIENIKARSEKSTNELPEKDSSFDDPFEESCSELLQGAAATEAEGRRIYVHETCFSRLALQSAQAASSIYTMLGRLSLSKVSNTIFSKMA